MPLSIPAKTKTIQPVFYSKSSRDGDAPDEIGGGGWNSAITKTPPTYGDHIGVNPFITSQGNQAVLIEAWVIRTDGLDPGTSSNGRLIFRPTYYSVQFDPGFFATTFGQVVLGGFLAWATAGIGSFIAAGLSRVGGTLLASSIGQAFSNNVAKWAASEVVDNLTTQIFGGTAAQQDEVIDATFEEGAELAALYPYPDMTDENSLRSICRTHLHINDALQMFGAQFGNTGQNDYTDRTVTVHTGPMDTNQFSLYGERFFTNDNPQIPYRIYHWRVMPILS